MILTTYLTHIYLCHHE